MPTIARAWATAALLLCICPASDAHIKVIGAGLARTGSNSFKEAIGRLLDGEEPILSLSDIILDAEAREGWLKVMRNPGSSDELLLKLVEGYQAVNGPPACFVYRDLMRLFPHAKVVVTQHPKGPEGWYKSTMTTIVPLNYDVFNSTWLGWLPPFRQVHAFLREMYLDSQFMSFAEWRQPEVAVARYQAWTAELMREVPADKLLVFSAAQGWEALAYFLGTPVPAGPYPRAATTGAHIRGMVSVLKFVSIFVPVLLLLVVVWFCRASFCARKKRPKVR